MQSQFFINGISFPKPWREMEPWLSDLFAALTRAGLGSVQFELEAPNSRKSRSLVDLNGAQRKLQEGKKGAYVLRSVAANDEIVEFYDHGQILDLRVDCRISERGRPTLDDMMQLAGGINDSVSGLGVIGPIFHLALPSVNYPRPLPPRKSPHWHPNVVAYFLSRAYYDSGTSVVDPETFERLQRESLPAGLIRRNARDLLIIQAVDHLSDEAKLKRQLYVLEQWIGGTLNLPRDEDFEAEGDQVWRIWGADRVKPFSFYDESTRTAYKVVAEDARQELDRETTTELHEALPMRTLPDGRAIKSTMVIFALREGAIANLELVKALGGSGVLYRDSEGRFWNPDPPGDWIRQQ